MFEIYCLGRDFFFRFDSGDIFKTFQIEKFRESDFAHFMIMKPNWNYVPRLSHLYAGKPLESTFLLFLHSAQIMALRNTLIACQFPKSITYLKYIPRYIKVNSYNFHSLKLILQDLKQFLKPLKPVFSFFWNGQKVDIICDAITSGSYIILQFLTLRLFRLFKPNLIPLKNI